MDPITQSIPGFQEAGYNRPGVLSQAAEFIDSRPDFQAPVDLVPMDEYETRLMLIETIVNMQKAVRHDKDWQISVLQFTVLLCMPLAALETPKDHTCLREYLDRFGMLFNHFFQKDTSVAATSGKRPSESLSRQTASQRPAPLSVENLRKLEGEIGCDEKERDKCCSQDREQCIITATGDAHVCHIIPFAWNRNLENIAKTDYIMTSITSGMGLWINTVDISAFVSLSAELGASDKAWNMLTLAPSLQTWWRSGFFGLKFMGKTPSESDPSQTEVQLQFRWMPRSRESNATRKINIQDQRDPEKCLLADLTHYYGEGERSSCAQPCGMCDETALRTAYNARNHHRVASGAIFKVMRDTATVKYFQVMIEIQWAIICAAAMSGAAQSPELLVSSDDEDHFAYWQWAENEGKYQWAREGRGAEYDSNGESI
ncbi:hypothetical protein AK830_g1452 [Neonectria ditissima]|uniref:Uncharacterized protein n=1 Tax=Neonectria ditissima TaxID=78410 RepID=A0A0N8H8N8_9HYPO|nr:hypothetical protein AK830_g1452 [Neonectria ditissima]